VHRDLKPENLLLSDPSDTAILKIADFGLSAIVFAAESMSVISTARQDCKDNIVHKTVPFNLNKNVGCEHKSSCNGAGTTVFMTPIKSPQHSVLPVSLGPPLTTTVDILPTGALRRLKSVVGSPHYIAPEIASNGMPMVPTLSFSSRNYIFDF